MRWTLATDVFVRQVEVERHEGNGICAPLAGAVANWQRNAGIDPQGDSSCQESTFLFPGEASAVLP